MSAASVPVHNERAHAHSRTRVRFLRTSLTVTNGPPWRGMLLVGEHTRRRGFSVCVYTHTHTSAPHVYKEVHTRLDRGHLHIIRFPKNHISDERNVNTVYEYALSRVMARKPGKIRPRHSTITTPPRLRVVDTV